MRFSRHIGIEAEITIHSYYSLLGFDFLRCLNGGFDHFESPFMLDKELEYHRPLGWAWPSKGEWENFIISLINLGFHLTPQWQIKR